MGKPDSWGGERNYKLIRALERKVSSLETTVAALQSTSGSGTSGDRWAQIICWDQPNSTPHFLPLASDIERITPISDLQGIRAPMPVACTVLAIALRPQASAGSTTLDLYVNGSVASSDTQDLTAGSNTIFTFDQGLAAGDDLAVLYSPTNTGNDITGCILFRFD